MIIHLTFIPRCDWLASAVAAAPSPLLLPPVPVLSVSLHDSLRVLPTAPSARRTYQPPAASSTVPFQALHRFTSSCLVSPFQPVQPPPPHLPPQVAIRQTYPHDYWTIGSQLLSRLVPPALGTLRASRCPESAFQLLFFGQTPHILERDTFY